MQKRTKKWLALTVVASLTLTLAPTVSLAANRSTCGNTSCQQKIFWQCGENSNRYHHFLSWQDIACDDDTVEYFCPKAKK